MVKWQGGTDGSGPVQGYVIEGLGGTGVYLNDLHVLVLLVNISYLCKVR